MFIERELKREKLSSLGTIYPGKDAFLEEWEGYGLPFRMREEDNTASSLQ